MTPARPVHAVFDLDGTLVDSVGLCTQIMNDMLAERGSGLRLTTEQARPHITMGGLNMVEALFGAECGDPDREIADFRARYRDIRTPASSLFPGVREGLETLAGWGVRLSVCSNKPQGLCEKVLADLELLALFDAVVGSDPSLPLKPDPALFDKTLRLAGAARDRCCYVGDTEVDHALAGLAEVPFILVTYGYAEPGGVFPGARRADHFDGVPALVRDAMASRPGSGEDGHGRAAHA
jgi:phosphoglycolate phosphatase